MDFASVHVMFSREFFLYIELYGLNDVESGYQQFGDFPQCGDSSWVSNDTVQISFTARFKCGWSTGYYRCRQRALLVSCAQFHVLTTEYQFKLFEDKSGVFSFKVCDCSKLNGI